MGQSTSFYYISECISNVNCSGNNSDGIVLKVRKVSSSKLLTLSNDTVNPIDNTINNDSINNDVKLSLIKPNFNTAESTKTSSKTTSPKVKKSTSALSLSLSLLNDEDDIVLKELIINGDVNILREYIENNSNNSNNDYNEIRKVRFAYKNCNAAHIGKHYYH